MTPGQVGPTAGLSLRAVARVADVVLVLLPAWLIGVPLLLGWIGDSGTTVMVVFAFGWAVVVGYETWLTAATGQTIGKRAVGIRVIDVESGAPPGRNASLLRAALPPILGILVPAFGWVVPYIWAVWDRDRRGIHDRLARTVVVALSDSRGFDQAVRE